MVTFKVYLDFVFEFVCLHREMQHAPYVSASESVYKIVQTIVEGEKHDSLKNKLRNKSEVVLYTTIGFPIFSSLGDLIVYYQI